MSSLPQEDEGLARDLEESGAARRSTFTVLRDVVFRLTQVVEESTELIGASVHEELRDFREDLLRQILALVALIVGASFLTGGLAMLIQQWIQSWPVTLLLFGAFYVGIAVALWLRPARDGDTWK